MQLDNKIVFYLQWQLKSMGTACGRCRHPAYQILELISPWQNGRHFAGDIFRHIFVNENFCVLIKKKSLKFVPKGPIDNKPALV